jgi:hypothetical protein
MKRKLVLLIFCWLLILAAPPLREQFLTQIEPGHYYGGWAYGPLRSGFGFVEAPPLPADLPRDARLQAVALEEQENGAGKFGRGYDALIKQYPKEAWLIARRLKKAVGEMRSDRVGGELSDSYLDRNKAAGKPSPERDPKQLNFKPNELEEVIALARRGQKLEPDNAFFDWMLVYFLMSGWRDGEAWQVLSQAAKKPRFNDYEREWLQANLAAREWQLGRPLLVEEIQPLFLSVDTWPYRSRQREMARILAWEGIKAERRGDHAKALQSYTDFARLMLGAGRQAHSQISALVYEAMGAIALRTDAKRVKFPRLPDNDPHISEKTARRTVAHYFARYARAHGRADLAQEMTALRLAAAREQDKRRNTFRRTDLFFGVAVQPLRWSVILWWSASLLLMLLPMLALWWALLGGALRFARVPEIALDKRRVAWTTLIAAGTTVLCWAIAFYCGAGWLWGLSLIGGSANTDSLAVFLLPSFVFLLIGLGLPALMAEAAAKRFSREAAPRVPLRERGRNFIANFRLSRLLFNGAIALLLLAATIWWMGCLFTMSDFPYWFSAAFDVFPVWPQLAFCAAVALTWLPQFFAPADDKPRAARHLRLLHRALGNLVVTASVSYLLLLLVSLPVRARANADIAQLIERGERAMLLQNAPR